MFSLSMIEKDLMGIFSSKTPNYTFSVKTKINIYCKYVNIGKTFSDS